MMQHVCGGVCQHVYLCLVDVNMSTISPMYQSWCQFVFCCCRVRWLKAQINTLDPTWSSYTDWTHPNLIVSSRSYLFQGIIVHIHYPLSFTKFQESHWAPMSSIHGISREKKKHRQVTDASLRSIPTYSKRSPANRRGMQIHSVYATRSPETCNLHL